MKSKSVPPSLAATASEPDPTSPVDWRQRFDPEEMHEDALYLHGIVQLCHALANSDTTTEERAYVFPVLDHAETVAERLHGACDALQFYIEKHDHPAPAPPLPSWWPVYSSLSSDHRDEVDRTMADVVDARDALSRAGVLKTIEPIVRRWRREVKQIASQAGRRTAARR